MIKRVPICEDLVVLGVDPGFATVGLSVVGLFNDNFVLLGSKFIGTKKEDKKLRTNLRANVDDQRRYREIYDQMVEFASPFSLSAISAESYSVSGARAGNAWKAAVVYGGVIFWAFCNKIYIAPFMPIDLKKRFCKAGNTGKLDVENALCKEVSSFKEEIAKYGKTKREHIADATGHAVLLLEEIKRNRVMFNF